MITDLENEAPKVPVKPIPAATVISLRDSPTGIEVLMVQQSALAWWPVYLQTYLSPGKKQRLWMGTLDWGLLLVTRQS